jgi:hypothetical protein
VKTIIRSLAAVAALTLPPAVALADTPAPDTFTTVFSFTRFGPDGALTIAGNQDESIPISLPPSMTGWRCSRSPVSAQGSDLHEKIKCVFNGFELGIGVSCPARDTGTDAQWLWIRPEGEKPGTGVSFSGSCVTIRNHNSERSVEDGF